jgi:hypothetical protein
MNFHYNYFPESDIFSSIQQMILKYTCERNVELYRRQMIKDEEVLLDVSEIKKSQTMTI